MNNAPTQIELVHIAREARRLLRAISPNGERKHLLALIDEALGPERGPVRSDAARAVTLEIRLSERASEVLDGLALAPDAELECLRMAALIAMRVPTWFKTITEGDLLLAADGFDRDANWRVDRVLALLDEGPQVISGPGEGTEGRHTIYAKVPGLTWTLIRGLIHTGRARKTMSYERHAAHPTHWLEKGE